MSINYQFKYMPLVGKLSGESMAQQTETAINEIAEIVNENVAQAEIINTLAQDANNNSVEALEKANEALQTTGRVYVNVESVVNLNDYCQSELLWIRNASSTNLPVQHSGFLEVKTNSDKTHAEQIFIDDSSGIVYSRAGTITEQQVGEVINYVASYGEWQTIATNTYVTAELASYAPIASPAFTGTPTAPTPTAGDNTTKVATTAFVRQNALPLSGGTMTGWLQFSSQSGRIQINRSSSNNDGDLGIYGGSGYSTGAYLWLNGVGKASQAGYFGLRAVADGSTYKELHGRPDGTLTWGGKNIERIESSGTNYIRYASGLQVCWGTAQTTNGIANVTFPVPFLNSYYGVSGMGLVNATGTGAGRMVSLSTTNTTTTGTQFTILGGDGSLASTNIRWFAEGLWK